MATTTSTSGRSRPATRESSARSGRASARARGARAEGQDEQFDQQYDLLTAALIGLAVGATATLLLRRPAPRRVIRPLSALGDLGAMGGRVVKNARRAGHSGMEAAGSAAEHLKDYVSSAREAIDDVVAAEVRDLRRAIRKQRRRIGL